MTAEVIVYEYGIGAGTTTDPIEEALESIMVKRRKHYVTNTGTYKVRCTYSQLLLWGHSYLAWDGDTTAIFDNRAATLRFRRWLKRVRGVAQDAPVAQ